MDIKGFTIKGILGVIVFVVLMKIVPITMTILVLMSMMLNIIPTTDKNNMEE